MPRSKIDGYYYSLSIGGQPTGTPWAWNITRSSRRYLPNDDALIVWQGAERCEHQDNGNPPPAVMAEYERLLGFSSREADPIERVNIVEVMAEDDDCAFDQPCIYGHRVESHAVYCHNPSWLYAPRKCRRRQEQHYSSPPWPHEGCAGFRGRGATENDPDQKGDDS